MFSSPCGSGKCWCLEAMVSKPSLTPTGRTEGRLTADRRQSMLLTSRVLTFSSYHHHHRTICLADSRQLGHILKDGQAPMEAAISFTSHGGLAKSPIPVGMSSSSDQPPRQLERFRRQPPFTQSLDYIQVDRTYHASIESKER